MTHSQSSLSESHSVVSSIVIKELSGDLKRTSAHSQGSIIKSAPEGSLGYQVGLSVDSVITHPNNQAIKSVSIFDKTISRLPKGKM